MQKPPGGPSEDRSKMVPDRHYNFRESLERSTISCAPSGNYCVDSSAFKRQSNRGELQA